MGRREREVAADRLERTSGNVTDVINNALLDEVHHFFGFLIARIFCLQRYIIERRNDVLRAVSAKSLRDSAGASCIGNRDRNERERRETVDNGGILVIVAEFRLRNNTEIVIHIAKPLRVAQGAVCHHGTTALEDVGIVYLFTGVADIAGLVVEQAEEFVK